MALRFLFLLFLLYLLYTVLKLYLSSRRRPPNLRPRADATDAEEMVLDPQCQSYLPKREAIFRGGHHFCSEECAGLYLGRRSS